MNRITMLAIALSAAALTGTASAQDPLAVQQPVIGQLSFDTVATVPDRGRLLLGGISAAGATHRVYGPLPWGTSTGRFASRRSIDAGVFIHDFEAMDAALLAQPVPTAPDSPRFQSSRPAAAWRHLRSRAGPE